MNVRSVWFAGVCASLCGSAIVRAQPCTSRTTRTEPTGVAGTVIRQIVIKSDGTGPMPVVGMWLHVLRPTTSATVVRRQLRYKAADSANAERMGEALRRLRGQRLYADVSMTIDQCVGNDSINVTINTRDAWTLTPVLRIVPPATVSGGIDDRNLFGTGRALSITDDRNIRGHGGSFALTDPWLFGTDVVASLGVSGIAGNQLQRVSLRHRELSPADPWRMEVLLNRQIFSHLGDSVPTRRALFGSAQFGRIVGDATHAIMVPYLGVEFDSTDFSMLGRTDTAATTRSRAFAGVDLGLSRRAAVFDTVSWIVPKRGLLDVPVGLEGDVLVAPGHDRAQHAYAARYDAWIGRVWMPTRGRLITADAWTSGFLGNVREDHISRASVSAYGEAWRGFWGGRVLIEQLLQVDRDRRLLSLTNINTDPTYSAVPRTFRFANRTVATSLERSFHVRPLGRGSVLDAALFTAGSVRWDSPVPTTPRHLAVAVVGARLRVLAANGVVSSTRVDVSFPVASNARIPRRLLLSVTAGPLFDAARLRDGRRRHP